MTKAPDSCQISSSSAGGLFLTRPILFRLLNTSTRKESTRWGVKRVSGYNAGWLDILMNRYALVSVNALSTIHSVHFMVGIKSLKLSITSFGWHFYPEWLPKHTRCPTYQFLRSLGIKPMALVLLAVWFTAWATVSINKYSQKFGVKCFIFCRDFFYCFLCDYIVPVNKAEISASLHPYSSLQSQMILQISF